MGDMELLEEYIQQSLECSQPCHECEHFDAVATDSYCQCHHPNKCSSGVGGFCAFESLSGRVGMYGWIAMDQIDCRDCGNFKLYKGTGNGS